MLLSLGGPVLEHGLGRRAVPRRPSGDGNSNCDEWESRLSWKIKMAMDVSRLCLETSRRIELCGGFALMTDFHYEKRGFNKDILTVVVSGHLDSQQCDYMLGCMEHLIASGFTKVILDCSDLATITSVGLGMLVRVHSRMRRVGGDAKLAGMQGATAKVISLVQLDRILQMYPTVDDAIDAIGG